MRRPRALVSLLMVVAVCAWTAACANDDDAVPVTVTSAVTSTTAPVTITTSTVITTPITRPTTAASSLVYLVRGERIAAVARSLAHPPGLADDPAVIIEGQLNALVGGPNADERKLGFSSAVHASTSVRSVTVDGNNAVVDLSAAFASGGGTLSMSLRWAQLVYTVTSTPGITGVTLTIDGIEHPVLGGEGLMLGSPETRQNLELGDAVPAILVEDPQPFATITSPVRFAGSSNTFEATLLIEVTAADGTVMLDTFETASCGSGCRGAFDTRRELSPLIKGPATVRIYESSAENGRAINVVSFPVTVN